MRNVSLSGRFTAKGGGNNDIEVYVFDEDNYTNWKNRNQSTPIFFSSRRTVGDVNAELKRPGAYYLVFNNNFSFISSKTVAAEVKLQYEKLTVPTESGSNISPQEAQAMAITNLRTVNTAEVVFLSSHGGRYGSLPDLMTDGLLDSRYKGPIRGYSFEVTLTGGGKDYEAVAKASDPGLYSFKSTADAVIRFASGPAAGQPVH
jgi:hypothetical protein